MFIWAIGKKISSVGKAYISMQMARNFKEGFRTERNQAGESTLIKVVPNMTDNG